MSLQACITFCPTCETSLLLYMDDRMGINTARCPECCIEFEIRHGIAEKAGTIEIKENKPN